MKPQEIQDRRFSTAFRGYDPTEVRQFLAHIAGLYADLQAKVDPSDSVTVVAIPSGPSAEAASQASGEGSSGDGSTVAVDPSPSAADVLAQAQRDADDLLASARTEAQTIVARANDEAARVVLRARAESRGKPSAERNAAIEAALAEVPGDPEQAREQARLMISEARAVRERILSDLAKRRRTAHVQLEQLRVAREKLLETLRDARRVVEDASRDLSTAEVEARLAAETAGRRVANEPMPGVEELEAELFGGRFLTSADSSGRPLVGPAAAIERAEGSVAGDGRSTVDVEPVSVDAVATHANVGSDDADADASDGFEAAGSSETVAVEPLAAEAEPGVAEPVAEEDAVSDDDLVESVVVLVESEAAVVEDLKVDSVDDRVIEPVAEVIVVDDDVVDEIESIEHLDESAQPLVSTFDAPEIEAVVEAAVEAVEPEDGNHPGDELADAPADQQSMENRTGTVAGESSSEMATDAAPPKRSVDDLFARLRAERTEAADRARVELAKPPMVTPAPSDGVELVDLVEPGDASEGRAASGADVIEAEGVHELAVVIDVTGRMNATLGASFGTADDSEIDATVLLDEPVGFDSGTNVVTDELGQDPTNVADLVTQRVARAVKRHLRDEQGSALVALRTARGMPHVDALLGTDDEQRARLRDALDGAIEGEAGLLPSRASSIAHDIAGSIRAAVTNALASTADGSADAAELPESIAAAYRAWTIERLDALVRAGVAISA